MIKMPIRLLRSAVFRTVLIVSGSCAFAADDQPPGAGNSDDSSYEVVHGWPVLPEGRSLGAVSGVGVDSKNQVFVFHRGQRRWADAGSAALRAIPVPTVVVFDGGTGEVVAEWGEDLFVMPHGLTVDGDDNVWVTDVSLQQVSKYSPDGRLLLAIGTRGVAGNDNTHFDRPTAVAVAKDGTFFVSDGYRNTRVMKFSAEGKFLMQWGTKGAGHGEFNLPHGIAIDSDGRVYVADRSNMRIQIFTGTGDYLAEWKGASVGRPYDIALSAEGTAFVADGGDQPKRAPDRSGIAVLRPDGSLIGRFGRWGNYDGQFEIAHAIAVAKDGAVYVGDITGRRVQKFVRNRE